MASIFFIIRAICGAAGGARLPLQCWLKPMVDSRGGLIAFPGSAFGGDDGAGIARRKLRLRVATSYLYSSSEEVRYDEW